MNVEVFLRKNVVNFCFFCFFLWMMLWATYNTDATRMLVPGFPRSFLDLVHGLRSLAPFFALAAAIFIFAKNAKKINFNLFFGPLGFLGLYAVTGILACFFSKNPFLSFYWGTLYFSAIIILFAIFLNYGDLKKVSFIARLNWIIACFLAFGLIVFFFSHQGALSASTFDQFFSGARPFEGINGVIKESQFFGMPGTRPTGLGRYAGIAAIVMFANIWRKNKTQKIFFLAAFAVFFLILFFSRGRTSVIAFLFSIFLISLFKSRVKSYFLFGLAAVLMILLCTNFYQAFWQYLVPENSYTSQATIAQTSKKAAGIDTHQYIVGIPSGDVNTQIITLTGRTSTWFPMLGIASHSPAIGLGFHADRIFMDGVHAHNSLVQASLQAGILGAFFFALAFVFAWGILLLSWKKENIIFAEILGVLAFITVRGITESSAFFGSDYLFLAPILAHLQFFAASEKIRNSGLEKKAEIFGHKVDIFDIKEATEKISDWVKFKSSMPKSVVLCGMHGIVEAKKDSQFKKAIDSADLFLMDGMSLFIMAKVLGFNAKERVAGPDLTKECFRFFEKTDSKMFFLGDTEDTLKKLEEKAKADFPNIKIAGSYSPPFREFTEQDNKIIIEKINEKSPDILFVSFNLNKQEKWIYAHKGKINASVIIGVGAAFKFLSGKVRRAPKWMQNSGLEWLWRFAHEPKNMWRRVFIYIPFFLLAAAKEMFIFYFKKIKKSNEF